MATIDLVALGVTLRLAGMTVLVLVLVGTPIAWWLSQTRSRLKVVAEAVVALPLVLPPTVLGFYLLVALGSHGVLGGTWERVTGSSLAFSFTGLVIGSVLYSLPFVVQPLQGTFEAVGREPLEAAWSLRASRLDAFFTVASPMALRGYLTGVVLGFAHTMGEFGVVLMIGGAIPGRTQVLSTALFNHVEALEYGQAHVLSAFMLALSFAVLLSVYLINRRLPNRAS
jgi:molybdate transport system permease protein